MTFKEKAVKFLDGYGGKEEEPPTPPDRKKTLLGAVLHLLFRLVVLTLIILSLVRLLSFQRATIDGDQVVFNSRGKEPDAYGAKWPTNLDFPVLEFQSKHSLTFYETNAPTVQKIQVEDVSGFDKGFSSTAQHVHEVNSATLQNLALRYNTVDLRTNPYPSLREFINAPPASVGIMQSIRAPYLFSEETMKILYYTAGIFNKNPSFAPHSAALYTLFNSQQLAELKSCQLQITFENEGMASLLYDNPGARARQANVSSFFWHPDHFDATSRRWAPPNQEISYMKINQLRLRGSLEQIPPEQAQTPLPEQTFSSWQFSMSYVNNFNHTFNELTCAHTKYRNRAGSSSFVLSLASAQAVGPQAQTLQLSVGSSTDFCGAVPQQQCFPFWILAGSVWGIERMQVIGQQGNTLSVIRPTPINHLAAVPSSPTLANLPAGAWTCSRHRYATGDGCDCGCGVPDPDCLMPGTVVHGCADGLVCTTAGQCAPENLPVGVMSVSQACDRIAFAGETAIIGFTGTEEDLREQSGGQCVACPGDRLNFYQAKRNSKGEVVCNYKPRGFIDVFQQEHLNFVSPIDGVDPQQIAMLLQPGAPQQQCAAPSIPQGFDASVMAAMLGNLTIEFEVSYENEFEGGLPVFPGDLSTTASMEKSVLDTFGQPLIAVLSPESESKLFDIVHVSPKVGNRQHINMLPHGEMGIDKLIGVFAELGYGILLSAVTRNTKRIFVLPFKVEMSDYPVPSFIKEISLTAFPIKGPYKVVVGSTELLVSSAEMTILLPDSLCLPAFSLNLAQIPDITSQIGFVAYLEEEYVPPAVPTPNYEIIVSLRLSPLDSSSRFPDVNGIKGSLFMLDAANEGLFEVVFCVNAERIGSTNKLKLTTMVSPANSHARYAVLEAGNLKNEPFVRASRMTTIELRRSETEYDPQKRILPTNQEPWAAPPLIETNVGMFITPHRKNFADTNFCPNESIPPRALSDAAYADWKTISGLELSVSGCAAKEFDTSVCRNVSSLPQGVYRAYCMSDMPPSHTAEFTVKMPATNKWVLPSNGQNLAVVHWPETTFDWQVVFSFAHRPDVSKEELDFSSSGYDVFSVDSTGQQQMFTGSLDYKGMAPRTAMPSQDSLLNAPLPPNVPYLKVDVKLAPASLQKTIDLLKTDESNYWPKHDDEKALETVFASLKDLKISWELDTVGGSTLNQTLPMMPGYEYQLKATLELVPVYSDDLIAMWWIQGWRFSVVSTGAMRYELDRLQSQDMRVRYRIEFVNDVKQRFLKLDYTLLDFLLGIGAAYAYMEFGLMLLEVWQNRIRARVYKMMDENGIGDGGSKVMPEETVDDGKVVPEETVVVSEMNMFSLLESPSMIQNFSKEELKQLDTMAASNHQPLWDAYKHHAGGGSFDAFSQRCTLMLRNRVSNMEDQS